MKKKRLIGFLSVPLAITIALSLGTAVLAQPLTPPHQFWGTVSIEGEPAIGVTVSAEIDGVPYESGVTDAQGRYGWDEPFMVPSDDTGTAEKDGGVNGDEVVFKVNGVEATKTVLQGPSTFKAGGASEINLSIAAPVGPLNYVVVTPGNVTLDIGATEQFSASGYDAEDNEIIGLSFTWSVVAGGGSIDQNGLLTAGTEAGTFTNTIKAEATHDAVTKAGYASVTVTEEGVFDPYIYDTDEDGVMSKEETLAAVNDYLAGNISKDEALEVVKLYFS